MSVRAKFECQAVAENDDGSSTTVVLHAVYGDGTDNAAWSAATPSGRLEMVITNPTAVSAFAVGTAYYLDISPVQAAPAAQPIAVGDVIDPVPEAGHEGPQVVTAITDHPDGTALDLRDATPEEIAAALVAPVDTQAPPADPATPPAPPSDGNAAAAGAN